MSEMTKLPGKDAGLRARLFMSACGAALLVTACALEPALAADTDKPMVWIEVGGAFTQLDNNQDAYLPPFTLVTPRLPFATVSPAEIERSAPTSWDGDAKVTFEPAGTDWILSAGIVYGRVARSDTLRQQTTQRSIGSSHIGYDAYQSTIARNSESYMVLDFQAGKDVGLGIFGSHGHSTVSVGARYAQLNSARTVDILYQPTNFVRYYDKFTGTLDVRRKFTGIGPSLSWDASAALVGNSASGEISLDWGVDGSLLFGQQRVRGSQLTGEAANLNHYVIYQHPAALDRNKQIIVPNLGGFAGVSWRYPNAKISMGYRADMFFGAMDGGIDAARKENRGFYGPFATISFGIGG